MCVWCLALICASTSLQLKKTLICFFYYLFPPLRITFFTISFYPFRNIHTWKSESGLIFSCQSCCGSYYNIIWNKCDVLGFFFAWLWRDWDLVKSEISKTYFLSTHDAHIHLQTVTVRSYFPVFKITFHE